MFWFFFLSEIVAYPISINSEVKHQVLRGCGLMSDSCVTTLKTLCH